MSTAISTAASENHTRFAPHLEKVMADARDERMKDSVVSILKALATLRRESEVFNDLYKSSDVGFGNYHHANSLHTLVHSTQDAIQSKLGHVLWQKSQVENYFRNRDLPERRLPTENHFDDPDINFRDGMWSTLLTMRKAHRAASAYLTSTKEFSAEDRKFLIEQNETLPHDAERMLHAFESSKAYAQASDTDKTVYQRFKAVLNDREETRLLKDFTAKL